MGKYGWQRIAKEQGWLVTTHELLNRTWLGAAGKYGDWATFCCNGSTEDDVLEQLEAWWRAQVTA